MSHEIRYPTGKAPDWDAVRDRLASIGERATVRMIDGLPAFPDEVPEPGWRELRVSLTAGMYALRRGATNITCVGWGSDDPALVREWNWLAWACAAAGGGSISTAGGELSAEGFARIAGIPSS